MSRAMRYVVTVRGREIAVDVAPLHDGRLRVMIDGSTQSPIDVTFFGDPPDAAVSIGRQVLELSASGNEVVVGGEREPVRVEQREFGAKTREAARSGTSGTVRAPMPGRVVKVLVAPGDAVIKGTGVVVVEAMKMENELSASVPGVVERVFVAKGDAVERGAPLVEIR
jgi:biotin carboxyl carrier protein